MQNRKLHRLVYHIRHRYMTMNNAVIIIAMAIAVSWAWASVGVVQKNYALQREVNDKEQQKQLIELQTQNLAYEQAYYKSDEYLALEAREHLGVGDPGERVLVLPPNSAAAKASETTQDSDTTTAKDKQAEEPSDFQQWVNFLFGGSRTS